MTDGTALPEWLHFGHRKLPAGNADELRTEKTESSGTTSQAIGRLAISFPAPNRNASQVQLLSVSSLFRRPNNRIQIRISVRETTRMELIRRLFSFAAQQHQSGRADAFSHVANWATAGRGSRSSASHSPKYGVTSGGY